MTQDELADIFEKVSANVRENDFSKEELTKRIESCSGEQGHLDLYQYGVYIINEAFTYTDLLVFDMFNSLRSKGYIVSTTLSEDNNTSQPETNEL